MVEVLVDGQFGYYGTPDMTPEGVSLAAKHAFQQAKIASKNSLYRFDESARPSFQGEYKSPYTKDRGALSAGNLNGILLEAYEIACTGSFSWLSLSRVGYNV